MNHKHDIKTIEQMLQVVNANNIENFKKDFCSWLDYHIGLKIVMKDLKVINGIEDVILDDKAFHWIDDGKNDVDIRIKIVNK